MFDKNVLKGMKLPELKEIAKKVGVEKLNLKKDELIDAVLKLQNEFQKSELKAETAVKEEAATTNESTENQNKTKRKRIHNAPEEKTEQASLPENPQPVAVEEIKTVAPENPVAEKQSKPQNKNQNQRNKTNNQQQVQSEPLNVENDVVTEVSAEENVVVTEKQNQNPNQNQNRNKNQNPNQKKQNYRDPDYEFEGIIECEGVLEVPKDGGSHGYLRSAHYNYRKSPDDVYISQSQIRLFGLKKGDTIKGIVRPPKGNEQHFPLVRITKINGHEP